MIFLRIFGVVVVGLCSVLCLRSIMPSMSVLVSAGCCVIIASMLITEAKGVVGYYYELCNAWGYGELFNVLLKGFGIALLTQTGSEFCRDNGEVSLASKLELAGKLEIAVISLPLVKGIVELSQSILVQ